LLQVYERQLTDGIKIYKMWKTVLNLELTVEFK